MSELDIEKHAQARDILAPAFKAQSVKDLVPLFAQTAQQLADVLLSQAGKAVGALHGNSTCCIVQED